MEIDKSKLSAEEVAQLEAIEKKAGIPAQTTPAVPAGVEKSAHATPADNATAARRTFTRAFTPMLPRRSQNCANSARTRRTASF